MSTSSPSIVFIGGGNMASALIGGLLRAGHTPAQLRVVEPYAPSASALRQRFGVQVESAAGPTLGDAGLVVWAVKPQVFREAAAPCAGALAGALQLSVMAGIRTEAIRAATGSARVVRAMPNTPALIGQGVSGLYATEAVSTDERAQVQALLQPTGQSLWVERESLLDAVTAVSGSGPAYFFYVIEAMMQAGVDLGLSEAQARTLAVGTCAGAAALAAASDESPATLRQNVTSKGGTTHAAITTLDERQVGEAFVAALQAAARRAQELGDAFGAG